MQLDDMETPVSVTYILKVYRVFEVKRKEKMVFVAVGGELPWQWRIIKPVDFESNKAQI